MLRCEHVSHLNNSEVLSETESHGLAEKRIADTPVKIKPFETRQEKKHLDRVCPEGEYRQFSDDGCFVGPYF
jgi:hypothetical protein